MVALGRHSRGLMLSGILSAHQSIQTSAKTAGRLLYSTTIPGDQTFFHLGGRDVITGAESTILEAGQTYEIRMTAFNSLGAGDVSDVVTVGPLQDMVPDAPALVDVTTISSDTLLVDFETPALDGGSGIDSYSVEYDASPDFDNPRSVVVPVVREKQMVVVESPDVQTEVQSIRATVEVTNEVQSVRTTVNGVDEVQVLTTTADDVVAEVQTVTTSAVDTDEEQTITIIADDVDEIQLVRTYGDDVPEIQEVTASVGRVNEVQKLGIVLSNINTDGDNVDSSACYGINVGEPCQDIENAISGSFTVSFDFDDCGGSGGGGSGSGSGNANYCQEVVSQYEPASGIISCTPGLVTNPTSGGDHCVSDPVTLSFSATEGDAGTLQKAINELVDDNGVSFMTLRSVPGKQTAATVTRTGRIKTKGTCSLDPTGGGPASCSGEYEILYDIEFDAYHSSGDVPPLTIVNSGVRLDTSSTSYTAAMCPSAYYTNGCATPAGSAADSNHGNFYENSASDTAVEFVKGSQPSGMITLDYECESSVTVLADGSVMSISASGLQASFDDTSYTDGMVEGQYIRFSSGDGIDNYRKIIAINDDLDQITMDSAAPTDTSYSDVEYGHYYSDWDESDGTTGVSDQCLASRIRTTLPIDVGTKLASVSNSDWEGKIGGLPVMDSTGIVVSRSLMAGLSTDIGFVWRITFQKQPGRVNEMRCTTVSGSADCSVSTAQASSMMAGSFALSTTWPHEYEVESPSLFTSNPLASNIDASTLKNELESIMDGVDRVFGTVNVVRTAYVPSTQLRWSGGYTWTITFASRGGNIPALGTDDGNLVGSNVQLEISDEDSGAADTYQGLPDSASFSMDDPGTARDGNQVSGSFALSWDGNLRHETVTSSSVFTVQTEGAGTDRFKALSAQDMQSLLTQHIFGGVSNQITVTRSSTPSQWMAYTYTIVFKHEGVGGDVPSLTYVQTASSLVGGGASATVTESTQGTSIRGTFQLRFNGETTRPINHDASAEDLEDALNQLTSIAPSAVVVTRTAEPVTTGPADGSGGASTQVGGYVWTVTFASNVWKDPTEPHDLSSVPGNWFGPATDVDDTWESGFSKSWGKNVGNIPMMECIGSGLSTTNGEFPSDGCTVAELVRGTDPLGGSFKLCFDTTATNSNGVVSVEADVCTDAIAHNAPASAVESGGDGSSVEEKLEALENVGDVTVTRGLVNQGNGGYSWTIEFLQDADGPCQQKDDLTGSCNAPGNVPKICSSGNGPTPCDDASSLTLSGSCERPGSCSKLVVLDASDYTNNVRPLGSAERQTLAVKDPNYLGWADGSVVAVSSTVAEYKLTVDGVETACIPHNAAATDVASSIQAVLDAGDGGSVKVERIRSEINAPNGFLYYISIYDTGDLPTIVASFAGVCSNDFAAGQEVTVEDVADGSLHDTTCSDCVDGVVQRGDFTQFGVPGENLGGGGTLSWDTSPANVASHIFTHSGRTVDVTRSVLDKYGVTEWLITFVGNPNLTPPGAGDVPLLDVIQAADTGGTVNAPIVSEVQKGSNGLSGSWSIDYFSSIGPRQISFNEPPSRLGAKLSEMSTVGQVYVTRDCYPDCNSGGWGNVAVSPSGGSTRGGYEWKVYFLQNPGIHNGFTFPPGSGSIDSPSIDFSVSLGGTLAQVETASAVEGSLPLTGAFRLDVDGEQTVPIPCAADSLTLEQSLFDLSNTGRVSVTTHDYATKAIPNVVANVEMDATVLNIQAGSDDPRKHLAPGDKFRIGGADSTTSATFEQDGAVEIGAAFLTAKSPILSDTSTGTPLSEQVNVGEHVRVRGEVYEVIRNSVEVQTIAVSRVEGQVNDYFYQVEATVNGVTETTACLMFDASAADVQQALQNLSLFEDGDVVVTKSDSTTGTLGDAHIYRLYFVGMGLLGDNDQVVVKDCASGLPAGIDSTNSHVAVRTIIEGGNVEHQRITLSSDFGTTATVPAYQVAVYDKEYNFVTSPCIEWGAPSLGLGNVLDGAFATATFTVGASGVSNLEGSIYQIEASDFVQGTVMVGDFIRIGDSCKGTVVGFVSGGKGVQIDASEGCSAITGDAVFTEKDTRVIEAFSGKLRSATELVELVIYSDAEVVAEAGLFKLRLTHQGISHSTSCINYGASAQEVQSALDGLFDFNLDGVIDQGDYGHIIVTREGDRSVESGYGFIYTFKNKGSPDSGGVSTVLGSGAPVIQVAGTGDAVGCSDAGGIETLVTNQASVAAGSALVTSVESLAGHLHAGSRIKIDASSSATKTYFIDTLSEDGMTLTLSEAFVGTTVSGGAYIYTLDGGVPHIETSVVRPGVDEYVYDVFFTGSSWSNVPEMDVTVFGDGMCDADITHVQGGMNRNIAVSTVRDGGGGSALDATSNSREYVIDRAIEPQQDEGEAPIFLVPPIFTVHADTSEVQQIIVKDVDNSIIWGSDPSFKLFYDGEATGCLSYHSTEAELETALNALSSLCSINYDCVTVSKALDAIQAPNGFVYTVYFGGDSTSTSNQDVVELVVDATNSDCAAFSAADGESVEVETIQDGSSSMKFTANQLPLGSEASLSSSSTSSASSAIAPPGRWMGKSTQDLVLYRVTGTLWTTTFDDHLGDVASMGISMGSLPENAHAEVIDDVVPGFNPTSVQLSALATGVPHYARVAATSEIGVSAASGNSEAVPSDVPSALESLSVGHALRANEIQSITLAASYIPEVQQITTSASAMPEVQEVVLESTAGNTINDGHFSLRVPEVQVVAWFSGSPVTAGSFFLTLEYTDTATSVALGTGQLVTKQLKTDCISFAASSEDVQRAIETEAIENGLGSGSVRVTRSGDLSYSSNFGYSYEIEFVGDAFRGNVAQMSSDVALSGLDALGGTSCEAFQSATNDAELQITTLNESKAVGTDTPRAELVLDADLDVEKGQYQLSVDYLGATATTTCIEWDSNAQELEAALEALANIDSVRVDSIGTSNDASPHGLGRRFRIYFDGQGMHTVDGSSSFPGFDPTDTTIFAVVLDGSCDAFKAYEDNVLTDFSSIDDADATVVVASTYSGGHTMSVIPPETTPQAVSSSLLDSMPMHFDNNAMVAQSLEDDESGVTYTLTFGENSGNVASLVCNGNADLSSIPASCTARTIMDGNAISGYFYLGPSEPIAHDASALEVEVAIEAISGIGNVDVTRGEADGQEGYTWLVTYIEDNGNIDELIAFSSLQGKDANVQVSEVTKGNEIGGMYKLGFGDEMTGAIDYNSNAAFLEEALESISDIGNIQVSSHGPVTTEDGRTFLVTFLDPDGGDLPLFQADASSLTGVNVAVDIREEVKGSRARGDALHVSFEMPTGCSVSQVSASSSCGMPILGGTIQADLSQNFVGDTRSLDFHPDYSVQMVRILGPPSFAQAQYQDPGVSGSFQLAYGEHVTEPIFPSASPDDVRHALEALPDVLTVSVTRQLAGQPITNAAAEACIDVYSGSSQVTCSAECTCDFGSNGLQANDIVRVGDGDWFRVSSSYDGSETEFELSHLSNSMIEAYYGGADLQGVDLFVWSGGYEWRVTFHMVGGQGEGQGEVLPLSSPAHDLFPSNSAVEIKLPDCYACMYLPNLSPWKQHHVRARLENANGVGPYNDVAVTATPKTVPSVPVDVSLDVLSGDCLEVFFSRPNDSNDAEPIISYQIEYDTTDTFDSPTATSISCATPQCSYEICDLEDSQKYYVRVAARNSVLVQGNTNWSTALFAIPVDQEPDAPVNLYVGILSRNGLQVIFSPPARDGGLPIEAFVVTWSAENANADVEAESATTSVEVPISSLDTLPSDSFVYNLVQESLLRPNTRYSISVQAKNDIGLSAKVHSGITLSPSGSPGSPSQGYLTTMSSSALPITSATIEWDEPPPSTSNEDDAITGYKVEWWRADETLPEVQMIKLQHSSPLVATRFTLSYSPTPQTKESTAMLPWDAPADLVRRELINLGWSEVEDGNLLEDIEVTRSTLTNGYAWHVTFGNSPDRTTNKGDIVALVGSVSANGDAGSPTLTITTTQDGRRAMGQSEVQYLQVVGTGGGGGGGGDAVNGFYRLKFAASEYTAYISAHADASELEQALEQLSTVGDVVVTQDDAVDQTIIGTDGDLIHHYEIAFVSNVGNVDRLMVDDASLVDANVRVFDGDNSLDAIDVKDSAAIPGEEPGSYGSFEGLDATARSFTIPDLVTGREYYVAVAARNDKHGYGLRLIPTPMSITPPIQVPGKPSDVTLEVNNGYSDSVKVNFNPPVSDGGDEILRYRVELDPSPSFDNPIVEEFNCPTNNKRTVWRIETTTSGGGVISGGFFTLNLQVNGYNYVTSNIPYDATALAQNETGTIQELPAIFSTTDGSTTVLTVPATNVEGTIFEGDRLRFSGQSAPFKYYVVDSVATNIVTLTEPFDGDDGLQDSTSRHYGGRGDPASSRIHCQLDENLCAEQSERRSGSIQNKLEDLTNAITAGVLVDRDGPSDSNTFIWRITFMDDALAPGSDFDISLDTASLSTADNVGSASVSTMLLSRGQTYETCSGLLVVPSYGGLIKGLVYHARVLAVNSAGYSLPAVASEPQAPMVVPAAPSSVSLDVVSDTELIVMFASPRDNGGASIFQYVVEWSEESDFSHAKSSTVDFLSGGAPFYKTIEGLTPGVFYYVRVSARNERGQGPWQSSVPSKLNPHRAPDPPLSIQLTATTESMITVGWTQPMSDGGDEISKYRVEWDTSKDFISYGMPPDKGYKDIPSSSNSFTIELLSKRKNYYVRVCAINKAGVGMSRISSPSFVIPSNQVPGSPYAPTATPGSLPGSIQISWQHPRVPHHAIPCGGTLSTPSECPIPYGSSFPASNGGASINEYEVEVSEYISFQSSIRRTRSRTTSQATMTVTDLIPGRVYYARVLARNQIGSGRYSEVISVVSTSP